MHNQLSISSINEEQQLLTTLKILHMLYPAKSIVHVGSGQGVGTMHLWQQFNPENALFIDAMPISPKIEKVLQTHPEWSFKQLLVSESNTEKLFYETTNPNENGLLNPQELRDIWSNLREKKSYFLPSMTLDDVCEAEPNWLVVDTLSALTILGASVQTLINVDVMFARTIKENLQEIEELLKRYDFMLCVVIEGIHPSVVDAVFVKDNNSVSKTKVEKLTKDFQAQETQTKEIQKELETLRAAKNTTEQKCKELEGKTEQLSQEKEKLKSEIEANKKSTQEALDAKEQTIIKLQNEKTTTLKQKQDLEAQNKTQVDSIKTKDETIRSLQDEHTKAKEQLTHANAELQKEKEQLSKERDSLKQESEKAKKEQADAEAKLKEQIQKVTTLESKQQQLIVKEQQVPQLEAELAEAKHRQTLFQEELIKAEAQIELIKDLLLREPGL